MRHQKHVQPDNFTLHASRSSTSLSSSLSSAASSMLAPPSNSSQSDIVASDHAPPSSHPKRRLTSPPPRSLLANTMGQPLSRLDPPLPSEPPSSQAVGANEEPSRSTGAKIKRVFGRKKTTDEPPPNLTLPSYPRNDNTEIPEPPPTPNMWSSRQPFGAKLLTTQFFGGKKPTSPSELPPIPPPKPQAHQTPKDKSPGGLVDPPNASVSFSPPALEYMRTSEYSQERMSTPPAREKVPDRPGPDLGEQKDIWRKSDSTMSHHTVRPNVGARSPRPVSFAESFHSAHTIISPSRRRSVLVTEAEFALAEGDASGGDVVLNPNRASSSSKLSPSSSIRSKKRLSLPLSSSPLHILNISPASPPSSGDPVGVTWAAIPPTGPIIVNRTMEHTRAMGQTTDQIATLVAASPVVISPTSKSPHLPSVPSSRQVNFGFRHTAITITGGLAPAAGLAKRAVEKMGRAWGGLGSSSNGLSHSSRQAPFSGGNASSSNSTLDRSDCQHSSGALSAFPIGKGKGRRTPKAPSASWSLISQSSSTLAESDSSSTTGPILGKCLRGPLRCGSTGGLVFGVDLQICVQKTAVFSVTSERPDFRDLELRKLPALVVRLAQHILSWGVQEEGLFRVNGRPAHVHKLRSVFDTGADYDMSECTPGDLDPHAVASVFKTYLRQLPEPILTAQLLPYFEAAVTSEFSHLDSPFPRQPSKGSIGSSFMAGSELPQDSIPLPRKPSLSTLGLPKLANMQPSNTLLDKLSSLLSRVPQEYRDLMYTVAELIRATAKHSKETKMPLSNLLLMFCPSLQISPPLLRILCEHESIWKRTDKVGVNTQEAESDTPGSSAVQWTEGLGEFIPAARTAEFPTARPTVPTVYLDAEEYFSFVPSEAGVPTSSSSSPSTHPSETTSGEDNDSYVSVPEVRSAASPRSTSTFTSTENTSSSAESLVTPLTSSRQQSFIHLPELHEDFAKQQQMFIPHLPLVADHTSPPSPHNVSLATPTYGYVGTQKTPKSSIPHRISVPTLRIPKSGSLPEAPASSQLPRTKRGKIPSINFFSKRSSSSPKDSPDSPLNSSWSPYLQYKPHSEAAPSLSTPITALAATTPQSAVSILPPTLNLTIDRSDLKLGLDIDVGSRPDDMNTDGGESTTFTASAFASTLSLPSSRNIQSYGPRQPSSAIERHPLPSRDTSPMSYHPNLSTTSFASYHRLSFEDREEDWSQSVLVAAHAAGVDSS